MLAQALDAPAGAVSELAAGGFTVDGQERAHTGIERDDAALVLDLLHRGCGGHIQVAPAVAQYRTTVLDGGRERLCLRQVSEFGGIDAAVHDGRGGKEDGLYRRFSAAEIHLVHLAGLPVLALGFPDSEARVPDGN